jgi:hypothetical protein
VTNPAIFPVETIVNCGIETALLPEAGLLGFIGPSGSGQVVFKVWFLWGLVPDVTAIWVKTVCK